RLGGRTAAEYAEKAKDFDYLICADACEALRELKAEGIPFLLEALKHQAARDDERNIIFPIRSLDGRFVDAADLRLFLPFLSRKYIDPDGEATASDGRRVCALHAFRAAKAKARPH